MANILQIIVAMETEKECEKIGMATTIYKMAAICRHCDQVYIISCDTGYVLFYPMKYRA